MKIHSSKDGYLQLIHSKAFSSSILYFTTILIINFAAKKNYDEIFNFYSRKFKLKQFFIFYFVMHILIGTFLTISSEEKSKIFVFIFVADQILFPFFIYSHCKNLKLPNIEYEWKFVFEGKTSYFTYFYRFFLINNIIYLNLSILVQFNLYWLLLYPFIYLIEKIHSFHGF